MIALEVPTWLKVWIAIVILALLIIGMALVNMKRHDRAALKSLKKLEDEEELSWELPND